MLLALLCFVTLAFLLLVLGDLWPLTRWLSGFFD